MAVNGREDLDLARYGTLSFFIDGARNNILPKLVAQGDVVFKDISSMENDTCALIYSSS
jgi:hypothetical protein